MQGKAIWGRLSTKDRIQRWGLQNDACCVLCADGIEDHDHLFFTCPFSSQLWGQVMEKNCVVRRLGGLSQELD